MKITKKIMAVLVASTMVFGLTACGGSKKEKETEIGNSKSDIEIRYWNSGLGTDWLDAMIEAFEKENPEYNVKYSETADVTSVTSAYGQEDVDTVDLYMSVKNYDTTWLEPLNDILDAKAYGDSKTIGEKFNDSYLKLEADRENNYYSLTYGGGVFGIVYNKKMLEDAGVDQLPRTSDELTAVCNKLYRADCVPFVHFSNGGYWEFVSEVWFAQADGMDYYLNNFYACKDEKGNSPSKEVLMKQDGRYDVLKAYEKFITPEYVMDGSNTIDHVLAQTKFLNNSAAMMVNGSWLANEMKATGSTDGFGMMRVPVISAITKRLDTVKSDTVLRLLISAIDDVTDGKKDISEFKSGDGYVVDGNEISASDWDKVAEARNTVAANYSGESVFIPSYSNAKEGAKEFLKFMYSDKGYKIYTETLHMALPMAFCDAEINTSEWSSYELAQYDILKSAVNYGSNYISSMHPIFTDGGASSFVGTQYIAGMCSKNAGDRVTADDIWNQITQTVDDAYENSWLANIK